MMKRGNRKKALSKHVVGWGNKNKDNVIHYGRQTCNK